MDSMMSESLLPLIQLSITPVILISGLGALLIAMTNRLGRIVDRSRILAGQLRGSTTTSDERAHIGQQLVILFRRAKIVRAAVTFASLSMFGSGLLVVVIFLSALTHIGLSAVILVIFALSVLAMLASLAFFTQDIYLSLNALGIEVTRALESDGKGGGRAQANSAAASDEMLG